MEPALHVGDVVFVNREFDPDVVRSGSNGDILAIENYSIFVDNGVPASFYAHLDDTTPIVHRAIEKRGDWRADVLCNQRRQQSHMLMAVSNTLT